MLVLIQLELHLVSHFLLLIKDGIIIELDHFELLVNLEVLFTSLGRSLYPNLEGHLVIISDSLWRDNFAVFDGDPVLVLELVLETAE